MAWMPRLLAGLCIFSLVSTIVFAEDKPADPPTSPTAPKAAEQTDAEKEAAKVAFQQAVELQLKSAKEVEQPEDISKHVASGIELIEAKKYTEFLTAFVLPEEFKAIVAKRGSVDEFAKHFGEARAESMLERLKYVKGKKVWITADGLTAVFDLKTSNIKDVKPYLCLVKVDGKWYMKNKQ